MLDFNNVPSLVKKIMGKMDYETRTEGQNKRLVFSSRIRRLRKNSVFVKIEQSFWNDKVYYFSELMGNKKRMKSVIDFLDRELSFEDETRELLNYHLDMSILIKGRIYTCRFELWTNHLSEVAIGILNQEFYRLTSFKKIQDFYR